MDPKRWKTVNEVFHAALEVAPFEREGFIASAVEGDADLKAEVELLLQADADAGSYIETPLIADCLLGNLAPPVNPGDMLCDRFRIVRAVAEGGMGHVFEAFDSELAVHVALKVIRPEIGSDPEALARFRQEVRLARSITHPNVCRTYDLERETGVDAKSGARRDLVFLTMEFLEGETLATRIERAGPLPLNEALEIARQIAGALQAAHALGIVHRDMKPANVMLVPDAEGEGSGYRAVITDFGLARLDPIIASGHATALSHTARPIGTLAYMAPEQLQGAKVSAATDVYAFGLILFETVTGRRAFPSDSFLSGIAQRLTGPAPDPKALVPSLPEPWCRAIAGCLRTEPDARYPSAVDAVAVLEGGRTRLLRPARRKSSIAQRGRRKLVRLAACVLAATALFAGAFRLYRSRADSKVAPGALVYLTQVKNETGEKALDNLPELIRAGLAQSVQVNLLDQGRVGDILQQMTRPPDTAIDAPTAREIGMRAGAVRVVFATVSGAGGSYKLDVDIQQPDNMPSRYRNHWTQSFTWHSKPSASDGAIAPELLTTVRTASDWIRHEAGESANDIARLDVPPEDVTTSSWQALDEFTEAERALAQGRKNDAILAYQKAARYDPLFSLAYAHLGDVLVGTRHTTEGYQAYINALNSDSGQRLSRKERDFIEGSYASDTRDFTTALGAFRDYSAFFPNDFVGWFYQAYPLDMLDRPAEAIPALMRAEELTGEKHDGAGGMAYSYMLLGNYPAARKWIGVLQSSGWTGQGLFLQALDEFLEKRYPDCQRTFAILEKLNTPHFRSDGVAGVTRAEAEQGDYPDALQTLEQSIRDATLTESEGDKGRRWLDLAYVSCRIRRFEDCLSQESTALTLDNSPDAVTWASDILGTFYSQMPRATAAKAQRELARMQRMIPKGDLGAVFEIARFRVQGEFLLSEGNARRALDSFKKADILDFPISVRDYLARGQLAEAKVESDGAAARRLREDALETLGKAALRPALVWRRVMQYPPGFAADQMEDYLALARQLHENSSEIQQVDQLLHGLRPFRPARTGVDFRR